MADFTCPVVSAAAQQGTKELYERFRPGIELREKDRSDIAHLREVIARKECGKS